MKQWLKAVKKLAAPSRSALGKPFRVPKGKGVQADQLDAWFKAIGVPLEAKSVVNPPGEPSVLHFGGYWDGDTMRGDAEALARDVAEVRRRGFIGRHKLRVEEDYDGHAYLLGDPRFGTTRVRLEPDRYGMSVRYARLAAPLRGAGSAAAPTMYQSAAREAHRRGKTWLVSDSTTGGSTSPGPIRLMARFKKANPNARIYVSPRGYAANTADLTKARLPPVGKAPPVTWEDYDGPDGLELGYYYALLRDRHDPPSRHTRQPPQKPQKPREKTLDEKLAKAWRNHPEYNKPEYALVTSIRQKLGGHVGTVNAIGSHAKLTAMAEKNRWKYTIVAAHGLKPGSTVRLADKPTALFANRPRAGRRYVLLEQVNDSISNRRLPGQYQVRAMGEKKELARQRAARASLSDTRYALPVSTRGDKFRREFELVWGKSKGRFTPDVQNRAARLYALIGDLTPSRGTVLLVGGKREVMDKAESQGAWDDRNEPTGRFLVKRAEEIDGTPVEVGQRVWRGKMKEK